MARNRPISKPLTLLAALALALLAGCTQPVGQCEGGLEDLSTMPSVTVQNPC